MARLSSVFGVSNDIIQSYVTRQKVDGAFQAALELNKQIIVYGSSKQGKSSLIRKHLHKDDIVHIECSPATQTIDIYKAILRQTNVTIPSESSDSQTKRAEGEGTVKATVKIPLLASAEFGAGGKGGTEKTHTQNFETIEYNLSLAQDIAEILEKINFDKYIVLDNFHYLSESTQEQFAFDLRIFQDRNITFIILGIWRERNRLNQFNRDLLDRMVEVPVEPWDDEDLYEVIEKGSKILNVDFSDIRKNLIVSSFDSVGVLQELLKESCIAAEVMQTSSNTVKIEEKHMRSAIEKKLQEYSGSHLRSFETFAESRRKTREGLIPLFIPYYFLRVLLTTDFDNIINGFRRKDLQREIEKIHHRPTDIRPSDMSSFLYSITRYQINKRINPPLFDFDPNIGTVRIIDSTLYFFLRNCNREEVLEVITPPSAELQKKFQTQKE